MDALVRRNVSIRGRRTSLRLEEEIWAALEEIRKLEELTIHQLCALIEDRRPSVNRTSAIRAFIVGYFRAAATPEGHQRAGHGRLAGRRNAVIGVDALVTNHPGVDRHVD